MQESDTYLMIVDEVKEKQLKEDILLVGESVWEPLMSLSNRRSAISMT